MGSKQTKPLGLRQLFDDESSTYTYILHDKDTKDAIIIDPVDTQVDRDLEVIQQEGLNLIYGVNTHAHADHITGTGILKTKVKGLKSIISKNSTADADILIEAGEKLHLGHGMFQCVLLQFILQDVLFLFLMMSKWSLRAIHY